MWGVAAAGDGGGGVVVTVAVAGMLVVAEIVFVVDVGCGMVVTPAWSAGSN